MENPIFQQRTDVDNPNYTVIIQQNRKNNSVVEVVAGLPEDIRVGIRSDWEAPLANGITGMLPGSINGLLRMYGVKPATQAMTLQVWQGNNSDQDFTIDLVFTTYSNPAVDIRKPLLDLMSLISPKVDESGVIYSPGPTIDKEAAGKLIAGGLAMGAKVAKEGIELISSSAGSAVASGANFMSGGTYSKDQAQKTIDSTQSSLSQFADEGLDKAIPTMATIKNSMINNPISISLGRFMFFDSVVILGVEPDCDLSYLDGISGWPNVVKVSVTFRPLFMLSASDWNDVFVAIPESVPATAQTSDTPDRLAQPKVDYSNYSYGG